MSELDLSILAHWQDPASGVVESVLASHDLSSQVKVK